MNSPIQIVGAPTRATELKPEDKVYIVFSKTKNRFCQSVTVFGQKNRLENIHNEVRTLAQSGYFPYHVACKDQCWFVTLQYLLPTARIARREKLEGRSNK